MKRSFLDVWGWPIASLVTTVALVPTTYAPCVNINQMVFTGAAITLIGISRSLYCLSKSR